MLILTPIFDPDFSESSFGYRPYRSAQDAAKQVQRIIRSGRRRCVDMDLSKFFDRVQHDVLMARVARKVRDKRLLKLIGRYLRAGVMVDGLCQPSAEGTMQGGPLSPLLSNIYLDDLDKELEKRELPFVRYADDFVIFTTSEAAAHRVYASVERFLDDEVETASQPRQEQRPPSGRTRVRGLRISWLWRSDSRESKEARRVQETGLGDLPSEARRFDEAALCGVSFLRDRLARVLCVGSSEDNFQQARQVASATRASLLLEAVAEVENATSQTDVLRLDRIAKPDCSRCSGKGPWRLAKTSGVQRALSIQTLTDEGLLSLEKRWHELASLRRTAQCGPAC